MVCKQVHAKRETIADRHVYIRSSAARAIGAEVERPAERSSQPGSFVEQVY